MDVTYLRIVILSLCLCTYLYVIKAIEYFHMPDINDQHTHSADGCITATTTTCGTILRGDGYTKFFNDAILDKDCIEFVLDDNISTITHSNEVYSIVCKRDRHDIPTYYSREWLNTSNFILTIYDSNALFKASDGNNIYVNLYNDNAIIQDQVCIFELYKKYSKYKLAFYTNADSSTWYNCEIDASTNNIIVNENNLEDSFVFTINTKETPCDEYVCDSSTPANLCICNMSTFGVGMSFDNFANLYTGEDDCSGSGYSMKDNECLCNPFHSSLNSDSSSYYSMDDLYNNCTNNTEKYERYCRYTYCSNLFNRNHYDCIRQIPNCSVPQYNDVLIISNPNNDSCMLFHKIKHKKPITLHICKDFMDTNTGVVLLHSIPKIYDYTLNIQLEDDDFFEELSNNNNLMDYIDNRTDSFALKIPEDEDNTFNPININYSLIGGETWTIPKPSYIWYNDYHRSLQLNTDFAIRSFSHNLKNMMFVVWEHVGENNLNKYIFQSINENRYIYKTVYSGKSTYATYDCVFNND